MGIKASSTDYSTTPFSVNDRTYRPPPRPLTVICLDGGSEEYIRASLAHRRTPNLAHMIQHGYGGMTRAALPSFTNVNNVCIATGVPPSKTGISGNFFLDPENGKEVMMNSAGYLRCGTILAAAARAGRKVAAVTAKDKLCKLLAHNLDGIVFSAEKADEATEPTHGISDVEALVGRSRPEIYSAEASLFVLDAGIILIEHRLADFLYLTLTDYVQHKYAPSKPEALDFYQRLDRKLGRLLELDTIVGTTADHGMNAKNNRDGKPNIIFLESLLVQNFGDGVKVILPITDPYVVHHGSLGSMVTVHLSDPNEIERIGRWISRLNGITEVYDRQMAAKKLELPGDRIGDLVVFSGRDVVIGRRPEYHELSLLKGGLRSHGGRYEEMVPTLISEPLNEEYLAWAERDPRNFDIFDFTCNGIRT